MLDISYVQALLGAEVEVETMDGKKKITVPAGTSQGQILKMKNLGVPHIRGGQRGDLCWGIKIQIPKRLNKDEEKLLREIAQTRGEGVLEKKGFFGS